MVTEFDIPCTDCDRQLVRERVTAPSSGTEMTVAECPACGSRYYPESALEQI